MRITDVGHRNLLSDDQAVHGLGGFQVGLGLFGRIVAFYYRSFHLHHIC